MPWEFGQIQNSFWNSMENKLKFTRWTAQKIEMHEDKISSRINNQLFDLHLGNYKFYRGFKKYYKGDLTNILSPLTIYQREKIKSERLERQWDTLIETEKNTAVLNNFLLYGFFCNIVKHISSNRVDTFTRIKKRI